MITSEWPLIYLVTENRPWSVIVPHLVHECITRSTPRSRGLTTQGVRNVLSTAIVQEAVALPLTAATTFFKSSSCKPGLVQTCDEQKMVKKKMWTSVLKHSSTSSQTSLVAEVTAAPTSSALGSARVTCTPLKKRLRYFIHRIPGGERPDLCQGATVQLLTGHQVISWLEAVQHGTDSGHPCNRQNVS